MRAYGIIRRFDDLGRIVIPKEVRIALYGTSETGGKPIEIYYDKDALNTEFGWVEESGIYLQDWKIEKGE